MGDSLIKKAACHIYDERGEGDGSVYGCAGCVDDRDMGKVCEMRSSDKRN